MTRKETFESAQIMKGVTYLKKKNFYEVIKFIEHGSKCRLTMDYVEGELLINRLQQGEVQEKQEMLGWFLALGEQLEQYHRCSKAKCYYYLNPYSVLITKEGKLMLLDLAAESNGFVLKNLQKRSMRQHFIKTELQSFKDPKLSKDLYGLGKTIQFVLAHVKVEPRLSPQEESRLTKVISKCLGENPKKCYENLKQIQKELPQCKRENSERISGSRNRKVLMAAVVILIVAIVGKTFLPSHEANELIPLEVEKNAEELPAEEMHVESEWETEDILIEDVEADLEDVLENAIEGDTLDSFGSLDLFGKIELLLGEWEDDINSYSSIEKKTKREMSEQLELYLVRYLATLYEEEYKIQEAIWAYQRLGQLETEEERLIFANQRKEVLEKEQALLWQALHGSNKEPTAPGQEVKEDETEQHDIVSEDIWKEGPEIVLEEMPIN